MFDLEYIKAMNEQHHLVNVERTNNGTYVERPVIFPLAELARMLVIGPPSLSAIIANFEGTEVIEDFRTLVNEFLPEFSREIMSGGPEKWIPAFTYRFGQKYFPLAEREYEDEELEMFVREIPVELYGIGYEDYHSFADFREGYILLLSLVESPFVAGEDEDDRLPILQWVSDKVGNDLVQMIPKDGWTPDFLHQMTDNSEWEAVGLFADYLWHQTDCWLLDADYDSYEMESWNWHAVQGLTDQWPRVVEIQEKCLAMYKWLEEDLEGNFRKLLKFITRDQDTDEFIVPKEQIPLHLDDKGQVIS